VLCVYAVNRDSVCFGGYVRVCVCARAFCMRDVRACVCSVTLSGVL
jgi:hypothetical protein